MKSNDERHWDRIKIKLKMYEIMKKRALKWAEENDRAKKKTAKKNRWCATLSASKWVRLIEFCGRMTSTETRYFHIGWPQMEKRQGRKMSDGPTGKKSAQNVKPFRRTASTNYKIFRHVIDVCFKFGIGSAEERVDCETVKISVNNWYEIVFFLCALVFFSYQFYSHFNFVCKRTRARALEIAQWNEKFHFNIFDAQTVGKSNFTENRFVYCEDERTVVTSLP